MISLWWWYLQGYNWNGFRSHLGPWLFWSLRNLVPKKFGPREIWALLEKAMWWFSCGDQISWGPYFSGTKLLEAHIFWGRKKSGAKMRLGTISVKAIYNTQKMKRLFTKIVVIFRSSHIFVVCLAKGKQRLRNILVFS